jgi:RNA polymerase sigma-70 factor (ECF subfamily)
METILAQELAPAAARPFANDLADFDSVAQVHQSGIFRYILVSLRDRDAAETLTQECLLRAYKARDRFRGEASVKTWLMQIAVNLVRNHQTNARLKFWRHTRQSNVDLSLAGDWLHDRQSSPEAAALAKQQVEAIWTAAAELSEKQRTVFLLRFVEDMDILQIAGATGMKEGTVKTHVFRALQAVRSKLEASQSARKNQ